VMDDSGKSVMQEPPLNPGNLMAQVGD